MKLLTSDNYFDEVKLLFENEDKLDLSVAFLGGDALQLFENSSNKTVRLICNFESGACNPFLVEKLLKLPNVEFKSNPRLHAKVALQKSAAIIGSANFSANGLSLEGTELTAWKEVGLKVSNKDIIEETQCWFENTWKESNFITSDDVTLQFERWKNRRINRPLIKTNQSLIEASLNINQQLLEREIYFAVYSEAASPEADFAFKNAEEESDLNFDSFIFYESWDLPDNSYLISVHIGPKGGVTVEGLYHTPEIPMESSFKYPDGREGSIKVCSIINNLLGYKLTSKDKDFIRKRKHHITNKKPGNESAYIIPLSDWVNSVVNEN